jgi:hypothetical protein
MWTLLSSKKMSVSKLRKRRSLETCVPRTVSIKKVYAVCCPNVHNDYVCRAYARLGKFYDDQIRLAEKAASEANALIARQQQDFRNEQQLRATRREWDLNRPDAKLLDRPARDGDDDARCGMSSMQVLYKFIAINAKKRLLHPN